MIATAPPRMSRAATPSRPSSWPPVTGSPGAGRGSPEGAPSPGLVGAGVGTALLGAGVGEADGAGVVGSPVGSALGVGVGVGSLPEVSGRTSIVPCRVM